MYIKKFLFFIFMLAITNISYASILTHCPPLLVIEKNLPALIQLNKNIDDEDRIWVDQRGIKWQISDASESSDNDFHFRLAATMHFPFDQGVRMSCLYYSDAFDNGQTDVTYVLLYSVNYLAKLPVGDKWDKGNCEIRKDHLGFNGNEAACLFEIEN